MLPRDAASRIVPDWICEVVSSTTRHHDVTIKRPYARLGVRYLWLVDIEARAVIAHRLDADWYTMIGRYTEDGAARIEPFEAVPMAVLSWWA